MTVLRDLAQQAVDHGISVVAARMDGTKRPVGEWKQYQRRLAAGDELDRWFGDTQEAIGVICGRVSGGLEMIEFEGRAIKDGTYTRFQEAMLASGLADLWRRITDGYQETTPSGGLHVFYRCEHIEGNKKLARRRTDHGEIQVLIETRGEGGFVVIAPTTGNCHPTGRPWTRTKGSLETIATITPGERTAIHAVAESFDTYRNTDNPNSPTQPVDDERPGDRYNSHPDAIRRTYQLLKTHGWQLDHVDRDGTKYLTRPGKNTADGISATLGHPKTGGQGFYVFTTSSEFEAERSYNPFQVYTILQHQGDYAAAARHYAAEERAGEPDWTVTTGTPKEPPPLTEHPGITPINLNEVITGTFADEQWLVEPIIPKNRQTSIYAKGKSGKSLLGLEIACSLASGRPVAHEPEQPPTHVIYIDFEMTPGDLQERLLSLDHTPKQDDWTALETHLHYYLLQPFSPFDTREGGEQLVEIVQHHDAELIVIDTLIRSVEGEENSADTIKNFNRYTGQRIKALGKTLVRVDHAGKDDGRGQRGSSAKRDDVDLVWRLRSEPGASEGVTNMRLINDACRMSWVPQEIVVRRHDYPLRHEIPKKQLTDRESIAWQWLEDIDHPAEMGLTNTWETLKDRADKPEGVTRAHLQGAQKFRRRSDETA